MNRTEYADRTNGQRRKLRTFNSRTGEDKWFPAGRDYYDHNRQKFIINVPCLGYVPFVKTRKGNIEAAALIIQIIQPTLRTHRATPSRCRCRPARRPQWRFQPRVRSRWRPLTACRGRWRSRWERRCRRRRPQA